MEFVTLYQAASILNALFEKNGIDRKLRPQMLYNYAKNGRLGRMGIEVITENEKKSVSLVDVKKLYVHFTSNTTKTSIDVNAMIEKIENL